MSVRNATELNQISPATFLRPIVGRDHFKGRTDAPIHLIEYGDYACRQCSQVNGTIQAIQKRLGDRMCFTFRHFPAENSPLSARHAAQAAEAAGTQGRFWQMHELLLEKRSALTDDDLARYSRTLGLNTPRLMREVFNGTYASKLREDVRMAKASGVTCSATFFVNGQRCDGVLAFYALLADVASTFIVPFNLSQTAPTSQYQLRA